MLEKLEREFISYDRQRFEQTVDLTKPTTGVLDLVECPDWVLDCMIEGINLEYQDALESGQLSEEDSEYVDFSESDLLIGGWTKDQDGLYTPDIESDWSGLYRADRFVLQVVWSRTVKRFTSPTFQGCYPGQVDLSSPECESGYLAYCLPEES